MAIEFLRNTELAHQTRQVFLMSVFTVNLRNGIETIVNSHLYLNSYFHEICENFAENSKIEKFYAI